MRTVFDFARIKLTVWFLLIIMFISIAFSLAMYRVLTIELDRVDKMQRLRADRFEIMLPRPIPPEAPGIMRLDPELVAETKNRIGLTLLIINGGILIFSTLAAYFLAGKTLRPIKEMIDEQKQFITDSSHELRTPLTSLKAEIEVSLRDKKLTLTQAKNLLQSNLEEVNKLQKLSDGLIELARYETNNTNGIVFAEVSLENIVAEAVDKVSGMAKTKNISIEQKIESSLKIVGNKQMLTELLTILIDNAIKYSTQDTKISISCKKNDGTIIFSVSDCGIGIAKEDIPHIFDRFYRVDKSRTKTDVSGYGLGLAIAKKIADKHSGSINVKSKLGKGSTFIVSLPIKQ